ncbi:MAG: carboxypeptidase-like regulatory domain-containing protein [candidate division KSB1 bacterium]|nr:carboxypeptidase-like regulatory domain-containing protein [candidate division KSB1 bacterium]
MKRIVFILPIFLVALPTPLFAQSEQKARLTGRVLDANTEEPLILANVYLAGTKLGDATDQHGYFLIENVPPGDHELIVSMIGYEAQKIKIPLSPAEKRNLVIALQSTLLPGGEATVTAKYPKAWQKDLQIFLRAFFGFGEWAKECRLLNPEVLDFEHDKASGIFQAFAQRPIKFVNQALGYEVTLTMYKFEIEAQYDKVYGLRVQQDYAAFEVGQLNCLGRTTFKELSPHSEKERTQWENNRAIAYNGSLRHFLTALCAGRLKEEGFAIWATKHFSDRFNYKVQADTLLRPSSDPNERFLCFKNWLNVKYKKEKDDISHQINLLLSKLSFPNPDHPDYWKMKIASKYKSQDSWIRIVNGDSLTITTTGLVVPGTADLLVAGYWGWEGAADWLPTNYIIQHRNGISLVAGGQRGRR